MSAPGHVLAIAHGYGNRRTLIEDAVATGVDRIECDLRYDGRTVWVRHERRLGPLPLLYNYHLAQVHRRGPLGWKAGPLWLRLDRRPLSFAELLRRHGGRSGLLLDFKAGRYRVAEGRRFVARVLEELRSADVTAPVEFCGSWALLGLVRAADADATLVFSVDSEREWRAFEGGGARGAAIPAVSVRLSLLTPERAAWLRARAIRFYCWDVQGKAGAARAIEAGAAGIIAGDLALLRAVQASPYPAPEP
jgi:glycerophosphoryl diester phosphodiesterase